MAPSLRHLTLALFLRHLTLALFLPAAPAPALEILLDFSLDEQNYNWFDPATTDGQARRAAIESAAGFLSTIITDDDWNPVPSLNTSFSISDVSESTLKNIAGATVSGTAETDGAGYVYSFPTSNRSSLGANQVVIYVAAFYFDSGTSSHAKGGWNSSGSRNGDGDFSHWGGRIWFNLDDLWYTGTNPGINPTNDYGIQDPNKSPGTTDITTDNWDWHTSLFEWKGFQIDTVDPSIVSGAGDLYGIALHELIHALGLTSSNFANYIGTNGSSEATGANLVAEYGGPVPITGGHFDYGTQSEVWDSDGIISETSLDPSTTNGRRKFLTRLDAAALRDLGYEVAERWSAVAPDYGLTITSTGSAARLDWTAGAGVDHVVEWTTNLQDWTPVEVGEVSTWTDPAALTTRRFYRVTD